MSRNCTLPARGSPHAIPAPVKSLADFAFEIQSEYDRQTSTASRKEKGQYFTPPQVCRFMAGLFSKPTRDRYRLLDPGAGVGSLTAAVCERMSESPAPLAVEAVLFENDKKVVPYLQRTMNRCRTEMEKAGHLLTVTLHESDFILDAAASMQGKRGLFQEEIDVGEIDCVIMNPPYFKLHKTSEYAKVMNAVVHGQPNIYAFFLAAATQMLRPGGEMVAITPRSFCNGLYFRGFRHWFFERMALDHIHLFESRADTFSDVLQESIITQSHRLGRRSTCVTVSTSFGRDVIGDLRSRKLPTTDILDISTGDCVVRVPATDEDSSIMEAVESWPNRFSDLELCVSTGPVVTFRAREFLLYGTNGTAAAPLFTILNVKPFETVWPALHKKHPNAFKVCAASMKLLLPSLNYVLLRRFSAKEERRRLTASCLIGASQPGPYVALENHLNYIYHASRELSLDETFGLAALFNSALLDRYFRSVSGNTQVNATELRTMPLPSLRTIAAIGRKIQTLPTLQSEAIEKIILTAVGINGSLGRHLNGSGQ